MASVKIRAALYARVSSEKQAKQNTIASQVASLRERIAGDGLALLRDWRAEDWSVFWEATNTPAVMRWLGGVQDAAARAAGEARIESYCAEHGHTFWVVERKTDSALLGFCGLKRSNQPGGPQGMMEVGWRLREDAWGKGYAKEAATASLALAFDHFGADVQHLLARQVVEHHGHELQQSVETFILRQRIDVLPDCLQKLSDIRVSLHGVELCRNRGSCKA